MAVDFVSFGILFAVVGTIVVLGMIAVVIAVVVGAGRGSATSAPQQPTLADPTHPHHLHVQQQLLHDQLHQQQT